MNPQKPLSILIVDDSQVARRGLRAILSRQWTVSEAEDGRTGIQKFEECKPDAVVLDWMMPGMDGVQTAKHMSSVHPEVPLILFTVFEVTRH